MLDLSLLEDVKLGDVERVTTVDVDCELELLMEVIAGGVGAGLFLRVRVIGFGLSGKGLKRKQNIRMFDKNFSKN